ncbi:MAG: hypothetical protein FWD91_01410 [Treponema sp.]|nr:hypothetical protein [Treponema sp.]
MGKFAEMPEHIEVKFNHSQITTIDLHNQAIHIYGVPVRASRINIRSPVHYDPAHSLAYAEVTFLQRHITLADSTELNLITAANLIIYKDEQRWVLRTPPERSSESFSVKQAGETEFVKYRSITFKPNWGEFIEGEPL